MGITLNYKNFSNSKDNDYIQALKIYYETIAPSIRTDTNEISFWLDNYNETFEDRFYVLGFYVNNNVAGFAQLIYFKKEKLVVIDYLTIDKKYRGNHTFYGFIAQIKEFLESNNLIYDYIVTEIGFLNKSEKEPSRYSQKLIRLLKQQNFGVIKSNYFQPRLGGLNYESEMRAVLMIYSNSEITELDKKTFLMIVKTIYFKHYLRWYEKFENKMEEYKENLENLYSKIERAISKTKIIKINGYKIEEDIPLPPKKKFEWAIFFASLLFITVLSFIMMLLRKLFDLSIPSLALIYFTSLITYFAILASYSESKQPMQVFEKLLTVLKRFSGKSK